MRYDVRAVYLGTPGQDQECPAHLVGQADTVSIDAGAPAAGTGGAAGPPVAEHQAAAGLSVTATYGADPGLVKEIVNSVRAAAAARPSVQRQSAPMAPAPSAATPTPGAPFPAATPQPGSTASLTARKAVALPGFDTCTAPSLSAMQAWRKTYSAAAIYIGGAEMACDYGNLSTSWVHAVKAMGWSLIPIYVGLQAPCNSFHREIAPGSAAAQGTGAAAEAVLHAQWFGIGQKAPLYFDMEAYDSADTSCRNSVLSFLDAWTRELHALGYVSGVYSSAASGAEDLGNSATVYGRPLVKPDAMWFALWDDRANLTGTPYLSSSWWTPNRRIKQYEGPHWQKVSGIELNIDSDWVQGPVY